MVDKKWLRYQAVVLAKREGISLEDALERVMNDPALGRAEEPMTCPICDTIVKGKNLESHMKKHHGPKIKWGKIPVINEQRKEKRKIRGVAGRPKTHFVSGGLPGHGKKK